MEFFILLCAFLLFCFMAAKIVKKPEPSKLIPGPKRLPIIGNLHQLNGPLPHRILRDLARKYGPLMHLQLGEISTLVVSSAEVAKEVMIDHDIVFANRPVFLSASIILNNCQDIGFLPYGSKICSVKLLSSQRIQTFRSIREEEILNMIKSISSWKGSVGNLSKKVHSLSYSIIARAAFGERKKYVEEFITLVEKANELMGGFSLVDLYPSIRILESITGMRNKLESLHERIDVILETIIREQKAKRRESKSGNGEVKENLVDVLLSVQRSGEFGDPLTDDNLKAVIYDIFAAGGETSATVVLWAFAEMIKNPTVLQRAQDEVRKVIGDIGNVDESQLSDLKYLQAVIKESLRFHPPAPLLLPRESSELCEINGYEIPAKTRAIINFWAIGRDPMHWTEPEKFNPDRFLDSEVDFKGNTLSFIPFGAGRRICPGILFAVPSMELQLAQLLYHFDWKLPGHMNPEDLDLTEIFGLAVGLKSDLKLIPTSYHLSVMNSEGFSC